MYAIFKKEIQQFFSSLIGYISIMVFLLIVSIVLWGFTEDNIFDVKYATLDAFFSFAPIVFLFLIPAITMRSFAEEINTGTIELLSTRPVTELEIILGKFFAALTLVMIAILPTLIYFYTIYHLASPIGNVDIGGIVGSYFGLIFLGAVFVSIGIFCSSITSSQIVAFMVSLVLCLVIYFAFGSLAKLGIFFGKNDYLVEQIGLHEHYESISRGILDTRDVIYFLSVIALFILLTRTSLASRKW